MRPLLLILICAGLLTACGGRTAGADGFDTPLYRPAYASGFEILGSGTGQSTLLRVSQPWQGAAGVSADLLLLRNGEPQPEGFDGQVLAADPQRIVCMSSTHIALLDAVGAADRIVGVSGLRYINTPAVAARRDAIGEVGYEGSIDYEQLTALAPDLVLLYGVGGASSMENKLRELAIPFLYLGDYLEESPLGKAEWIVAVGEIVGCRAAAEAHFAAIPQRYDALREQVAAAVTERPAVMINTPYGDSWFMASATSYVARLIADAGGAYLYNKNRTNRSLPIDLEEAAYLVAQADCWINVTGYRTLDELRRGLPKFAGAPCVRRGAVWNGDARTNEAGGNDYWESGIVHPDLVLRDLIQIFHPGLLPDAELVYYRNLP